MDNLTHGLAGALLAQAGFRQRYGRIATVALVVGAELPDLDFLFDLGGPVMGFVNHRGITHSLLGGAGLALGGALVFLAIWRYRPSRRVELSYRHLAALMYLGVLLHIWMDYLTSYGTRVFLPFDAGRYTADAVFIIDFFYTGIIVTALLLIRMVRHQYQQRYALLGLLGILLGVGLWRGAPFLSQQPLMRLALHGFGLHLALFSGVMLLFVRFGRAWQEDKAILLGRSGVVTLAAYMVLCMVNHGLAIQRLQALLAGQASTVQHIAALPLPGGPFMWRGIAETPSSYLVSQIDLVSRRTTALEEVRKRPDHTLVRTTSAYRLVHVFEEFARFPVVDYHEQETEKVIRYFDLRFSGYGREKSWFDLVVRFDPSGQIRVIEFLNHLFLPTHPTF